MTAPLCQPPEAKAEAEALARRTAEEIFVSLGTKWALQTLNALGGDVLRFHELRRAMPGVSHKMLTQTLRGLERDGLLRRRVHPAVPPRVDYALTEAGRELRTTVHGLCAWSRRYLDVIAAARSASGTRRR